MPLFPWRLSRFQRKSGHPVAVNGTGPLERPCVKSLCARTPSGIGRGLPDYICEQGCFESRVMAVPKLVGRAALDAAMVVSASCGAGGKLWLHADPKGVDLISWYSSIPGLTRVSERQFSELPGSPIPIRIAQRKNDGRYFASHASTSLWTLGDMDHLRS